LGNVSVVEVGNVEAAWMALPFAENLLPPPVAGTNTEQIQMRNSMPILHQYTEAVIMANSLGSLMWHWLWDHVGSVIVGDPQQLADYQSFVDYLQVSLTQRALAAAGGQVWVPATAMNIVPAITMPVIQDQAMAQARIYLLGLQQPTGWPRTSVEPDCPGTCNEHGGYCKCPVGLPADHGVNIPCSPGPSTMLV
jgi:hypothetical protein